MSIFSENLNRYTLNYEFKRLLNENGISMLEGYLDQSDIMDAFCEKFYSNQIPKIVICGINPGRLGAGLTGVPFFDFASLSKIFPSIQRNDTENTAQFFFKVIEKIGVERFFKYFYITNVSSVGYSKGKSNFNFNKLPDNLQSIVFSNFAKEIELIKPAKIIALGEAAFNGVESALGKNNYRLEKLKHPSWIMQYKRDEINFWVQAYADALSNSLIN